MGQNCIIFKCKVAVQKERASFILFTICCDHIWMIRNRIMTRTEKEVLDNLLLSRQIYIDHHIPLFVENGYCITGTCNAPSKGALHIFSLWWKWILMPKPYKRDHLRMDRDSTRSRSLKGKSTKGSRILVQECSLPRIRAECDFSSIWVIFFSLVVPINF